jgi:hypothetical protein
MAGSDGSRGVSTPSQNPDYDLLNFTVDQIYFYHISFYHISALFDILQNSFLPESILSYSGFAESEFYQNPDLHICPFLSDSVLSDSVVPKVGISGIQFWDK